MKIIKIALFLIGISTLTSCASGYKMIQPNAINYISTNENDGVKLEYKYDLLSKKYAKKELKKDIRLVAVKITNTTEKDLIFGRDIRLAYKNGKEIIPMENDRIFSSLKQNTALYLWYLLLTPLPLKVTDLNPSDLETNSTPIGLILGPGLAGGNMIVANVANEKFKQELLSYNINGTLVKKGETKYGLIGIRSNNYDALTLKIAKKNTFVLKIKKKYRSTRAL